MVAAPASFTPDGARRRAHSLDVLRGLAIALVLFRHMPGMAGGASADFFTRVLYEAGWTGVDLFFVLSGYLISGLLFEELERAGTLNLPRFWLRRGLKIWPSYFAAYGVLTLARIASDLSAGRPELAALKARNALPNVVFIQNYAPAWVRWPHSWSLAIEEHFYLLLPALLLLVFRAGPREKSGGLARLPPLAAGVCVGVLGLRVGLYLWRGGLGWEDFYYQTHFRFDALFFGVLLGYLHRHRAETFERLASRRAALCAGAVLALALAVAFPLGSSPFSYTVGFTTLYLGYGGLVVSAGARPDFGRAARGPGGWLARGLALLGVYSYTIYLAHSVVYHLPGAAQLREGLRAGTGSGVWADRLLFCAASVGGGLLLSHLVERPFLRLRDRRLPGPSREQPARDAAEVTPAVG